MAFTLSQTASTSGITTIQVSATTNSTSEVLSEKYTLSNSGRSLNMTVTQQAYVPTEKFISITPSGFTVGPEGSSASINVQSNDDWVLVSNGWIDISKQFDIGKGHIIEENKPNTLSGNGNTIIGIYFHENTGSTRNGHISGHCLSSGATAVTASTTVVQSGASSKPYINVDSNILYVGNASGTTGITIQSNTDWIVETKCEWIRLSSTGGTGNGSVTITYVENSTSMGRKDVIHVLNKEYSIDVEVAIEQEGVIKPYIVVDPVAIKVASTGSTGNVISVSANCDYDIETDVNWITLNASSGSGNGSVYFSTNSNQSKHNDTGNIIFSNSAVSTYVMVSRYGVELYLSANTQSLNFAMSGGSSAVDVYSNTDWSVNIDNGDHRDWIDVEPLKGEGDDTIRISASSGDVVKNGTVQLYNTDNGLSWNINVKMLNPNAIYYKSSNGQIVTTNYWTSWGANIISNTYVDGQGVILFDGPITTVGAFMDSPTLTEIIIPNSVRTIYRQAFSLCTALEDIDLQDGVWYISTYAFYGCTSLKKIVLGSSLEGIYEYAFINSSLDEVYSYNTTAPYIDYKVFPEGITIHYPSGADYSNWVSRTTNCTFIADL